MKSNDEDDYVVALSRLGLSYKEFLNITPAELLEALQDRSKYDGQIAKAFYAPICNAIRLGAFHTINIQLPMAKKLRRPQQLMKFEWDEKSKGFKAQTADEMRDVMKAIAGYYKNSGRKKRKSKTKTK